MKTNIKSKKVKKMENIIIWVGTAIYMSICVLMREVVYKDNHAANWWGTVTGVIVLAIAGMVLVHVTPVVYEKILNDNFFPIGRAYNWTPQILFVLAMILFTIAGAVLAFLPLFKQLFRVNAFLYYGFGFIAAVLTGAFISVVVSSK
jgi:multisubunit Na+/H+ antiporter MnhB subunit